MVKSTWKTWGSWIQRQLGRATLPLQLKKISTLLQPAAWESYLQIHTVQEFVQYISNGLQQKFRIMLDYTGSHAAHKNTIVFHNEEPRSGRGVPSVRVGWSLYGTGSRTRKHLGPTHQPIGVIPKMWQPSQPQKRCLIAHLSAPQRQSVNAGLKRFVNKVEMKPIVWKRCRDGALSIIM